MRPVLVATLAHPLACVATATLALAQAPTPSAPPAKPAPTTAPAPRGSESAPAVSRADLARAYLRFERACVEHPLADARRGEVHRAFDALTVDFFMGRAARAIARLDDLAAGVRGGPAPLATRLVVRTEWRAGSDGEPRLVLALRGFAPAPATPTATLVFRAHDASSADATPSLEIAWPIASSEIVLDALDTRRVADALDGPRACAWFVREGERLDPLVGVHVETPGFRARHARLDEAVRALSADGPPEEQALASLRARVRLLAEPQETDNSALFLSDRRALLASVEYELAAFARGVDPYRRRAGDTWRVVRVGTREIPVRVVAPDLDVLGPAGADTPRALVVALHGAGGDENMFCDAYGAGRLRDLARERGFVAITPRLGFTGLDPSVFDALVEAMVYDYPIDRARIVVVGHSMGAGAAYAWARARADRIAAVACLACGPSGSVPDALPPLFVVAGALDPIVPADPLRRSVEALLAAGRDAAFELVPDAGHTLLVGDRLPTVLDRLLGARR